jgi:hypothetical protein
MDDRFRTCPGSFGGGVGPGTTIRVQSVGVTVLLVGAPVLLAVAPLALPASCSWVGYGTSESAVQGVDGVWVIRLGFILYDPASRVRRGDVRRRGVRCPVVGRERSVDRR